MKNSMCGIVKTLNTPGGLSLQKDLPIPEIMDDEVLIKVYCSAICGTDLHIEDWDDWSKKRVHPPVIIGHETAGDIVAVGKQVSDRKIGDRVTCESHIFCGDCYFCNHGMPHICQNLGILGVTQNGAFAEYLKIKANCTFLLDDSLSYEEGCLFEPMGAGVHGAEIADVFGKNVLINGCGPIGLAAISACKFFGVKQLIVCARHDDKLAVAMEFGADVVLNTTKCDLTTEIKQRTNGLGVDVVIDVSGAEAAIHKGLDCLRTNGKMVCVGLPTKPVTFNLTDEIIYREILFTGISGRLIWDTWRDFSSVLKSGYFDSNKIIGQKYAMENFQEAFARTRSGAPGKNLLYPDPKNIR